MNVILATLISPSEISSDVRQRVQVPLMVVSMIIF